MGVNFALIGAAGYIAPRHLKAIYETKNHLLAALDPRDSVGILDQYSFDVKYFNETERFDRYLERLRRGKSNEQVHYISICSPNYLHDAHCRLALRVGANVICEKPIVINPWNLDNLHELELEYSRKINTILQLRLHPKIIELKNKLVSTKGTHHEVILTYITSRGPWYDISWKGSQEKSGGISVNIGIHLFDLLIWLFGEPMECRIYFSDQHRMSGYFDLENASVRWFLSINKSDLPYQAVPGKNSSFRSIIIDEEEFEFSDVFTNLHTLAYKEILAGRGFGIEEARPSIDLAYQIRTLPTTLFDKNIHPQLIKLKRE